MLLTVGAGAACTLHLSWFTYMKATIFKRSLVDDKESKELLTLTKVFNDLGNSETDRLVQYLRWRWVLLQLCNMYRLVKP
jgi:hypothetical protein